ncbi:MAG: arylsulfotransferase (ASST) [Planctomycetes bacterium]|nr:arylsulfotransferase (ASST) [Planctomycetota bacterium]
MQDAAPPAAPAATPAPAAPSEAPAMLARPRGLALRTPEAAPGLTLIAPLRSQTIRLVDLDGNVVHEWVTDSTGGTEHFLDDGTLLRSTGTGNAPKLARFAAGGKHGRLQRLAWDGTLLWDWKFATEEYVQHHDVQLTLDGTILFIAWEYKSRSDAIGAGRHPGHVGTEGMWVDAIFEIEPKGTNDAEVIWEWHVWDHLIQDIDPEAANYGDVAQHPERFDLNADLRRERPTDAEVDDLQKLGYIDAKPTTGELHADWMHTNALFFDAAHDQIVLSSPHLCEVFILDHSTTSEEARGSSEGQYGKGGDLLWRWGNPRNYGAGSAADQRLWYQHNVQIIGKGLPGAGHVLLFNNGGGRPDGSWSSVLELELPRTTGGGLALVPFLAAGPNEPVWSYAAPTKSDFFSSFISGAQRLANGHTLICEGASGRVFEVKPDGTMVWEYLHPFTDAALGDGPPAPPTALFRATRIPADHGGLKGKALAKRP